MKSKPSLAKWEPIKNAPKRMILDSLLDTYEGFRLLLKDPDTSETLRITFESPYSYRNTNESYLLKTWGELEGVAKSSFHIIEGSQH